MSFDNFWVFDLEDKIFTVVKTKCKKALIDDFPKITFTTSDLNENTTVLPCVYIHELQGKEIGNDLENQTINAVMETLQVEVFTNTSKDDAKYIISVVAEVFKEMRFSIVGMPIFDNQDTKYRCVMRVRRVVGNNDL